jgi:hypothetical protein
VQEHLATMTPGVKRTQMPKPLAAATKSKARRVSAHWDF